MVAAILLALLFWLGRSGGENGHSKIVKKSNALVQSNVSGRLPANRVSPADTWMQKLSLNPIRDPEKERRRIPPPRMPLTSIETELRDLAANGNVAAACRLSYEYLRCQRLPTIQPFMEMLQKKADEDSAQLSESFKQAIKDRRTAYIKKLQDSIQEDQPICEGFKNNGSLDHDARNYTLLAARLGQPESMLKAAIGMHDIGLFSANPANEVALAEYQADAPGFLAGAIEAGLPNAYFFAINASLRDSWGVTLLPKDPVMSMAYTFALEQVTARESCDKTGVPNVTCFVDRRLATTEEVLLARARAPDIARRIKVGSWNYSDSVFQSDDARHCQPK